MHGVEKVKLDGIKLVLSDVHPQLTFTCSRATIETLEKGAKYV